MTEENMAPLMEPDTIYIDQAAWRGFTTPYVDGHVLRLNSHTSFVSRDFVAKYGWLAAIGFVVYACISKQKATGADVA